MAAGPRRPRVVIRSRPQPGTRSHRRNALEQSAPGRSAAHGWAGVTVACEPTGHRWRVLGQLAADRSMPFVCVQPMVTSWSRRTEDLTFDKTDDKDAVLIARLTAQLRCYVPEPADETWARLRHLGVRREQLITEAGSQGSADAGLAEVRVAGGAGHCQAAVPVSYLDGRAGGDRRPGRRGPGRALGGWARRGSSARCGGRSRAAAGVKPCLRIVRGLFAALCDPAGVITHRRGALERVALLLEDWDLTGERISRAEQRMTAVLDELGLTGLVTSITGISAVSAAAILAETGDPRRFATARALVKHAGLAPREKLSGAFTGRTGLTGQGRPGLRLAAWRAVWGAQRANPVYGARYQYLTSRENNKLTPTQAQTVIAAAILRHLHAFITTGQAWDPLIAKHGTCHHPAELAA
jgi:transposase